MHRRKLRAVSLAMALLVPAAVSGQEGYRQPPPPIAKILDAEPRPGIDVSPDRLHLLFLERWNLPPIAEVAAPEARLAGIRINPRTNGRSREVPYKGLRLRAIAGGSERRIETPDGARVGSLRFSPDAKHFAFAVTTDDGIALHVAETGTGKATRLTEARLNGVFGDPCRWVSSAGPLLCRMVPAARGSAPAAAAVPAGPISAGIRGPGRSQPHLPGPPAEPRRRGALRALPHDPARPASRSTDRPSRGRPGLHTSASPRPTAATCWWRRSTGRSPTCVPAFRFPRRDRSLGPAGAGAPDLADLPLQEQVQTRFDAVPAGPRARLARRRAGHARLGRGPRRRRPRREGAERDRLLMLAAPFTATPATVSRPSTA